MSNVISNSPKTSPRLHTDFVEVKVHTAKCDSCDKHNKLTLYRCTECGQHVCSLCWNKKSGDRTHDFGGGFSNKPESYANYVDAEADGEIPSENKRSARSGRRVHVISDDEDDQFPVLKPAPTTKKPEVNNTRKEQKHRKTAIMDNNHGGDHGDDLPRLWPIAPAKRLPVLRPAVPAANTSPTESATQMNQRIPRTHEEKSDRERQRIMQADDNPGRQRLSSQHASIGNQETNTQARHPSQSSIPQQQATHSAPLQNQRVIYRQPPGVDRDRQAARNELAFANRQHVYQPFQWPPRPPQTASSRQHAQSPVNMDQVAGRNQQAFRSNEQVLTYANAQQMDASNRQAWFHVAQIASLRDRQAAYTSNQLAASAPGFTNAATRNQLSQQSLGPAQASASHGRATDSSRFPSQAFLSRQYAALQASRQAQDRIATQQRLDRTSAFVQGQSQPSPEILDAAGVRPFYAGVDRIPGIRFRSYGNVSGISQLLSAADQLEKADSARPEPRSSSKILVKDSGAAGTQPASPRGPISNPTPGNADADSVKARIEKHRVRLAGPKSSASTQNTVSDLPASQPGHPSYRYAAKQPDSGPLLANSSGPQSQGSGFRRAAHSHPSPKLPMSEHAATYINHWDAARAALSASSNNTAAVARAIQADNSRSPVPVRDSRLTTGAQDNAASGAEEGEVAGASIQAPSAPIDISGEPNDLNVAMGSPDVEVLEDDEPRRSKSRILKNDTPEVGKDRSAEKARTEIPEPVFGMRAEGRAEKHQRSEEKDDRTTSKKQKGMGDVDVIDARKKHNREKQLEQSDDDSSDVEITSSRKLNSNKTSDRHRGTDAGAKALEPGRRGVALVKKPKPKGRKG